MDRKSKFVLGAAVAALGIAGGGSAAQADTIAYDVPLAISGNQAFDGGLGLEFNTNSAIRITRLGAFDSLGDGLQRPVEVGIFDRDSQQLVGSTVTFSADNAPGTVSGTLIGGNRFADVPDFILPGGGHYVVVAQGYGDGELNFNSSGAPNLTNVENTGGGLISFVGSSRYNFVSNTLAYPTIPDSGPQDRYNAGTFAFSVVPVPPAVFGGAGLLGLTGGAHFLRRRRALA